MSDPSSSSKLLHVPEDVPWVGPAEGTLECIFLDALLAHPEGVTFLDLEGTGITEDNIEQIAENLRTGMYVSTNDHKLKFDA